MGREQLGEQFVRWVNATPNLQASTFRHPGAVQQAVKAPEKRGKEDPSEARDISGLADFDDIQCALVEHVQSYV